METSSAGYARRLAGPAGRWLLETQEQTVLGLLGPVRGRPVLEVGGGHGQLTEPLLTAGCELSVFSSPGGIGERVAESARGGRLRVECGDLRRLPYGDGSFDVVISVRLLAHFQPVEVLIGELCRVARRAVIVDYARAGGGQRLGRWLFAVKKAVEGNTRRYACFFDREIDDLFAVRGFVPECRHGQFVWPMALHRAMGRPAVSAGLERATLALGLRQRLGSPVIVRYVPRSG